MAVMRAIQALTPCPTSLAEFFKGPLVQVFKACPNGFVSLSQTEEALLARPRQNPSLNNLYADFSLGFILGSSWTGGQHRCRVMTHKVLCGTPQRGFVAICCAMSAGLSGAMKAGTPPINSIASTRAPIQSGIASDLRIAVGGSARLRSQIFFPRAVATGRPDGAAPDEFGHRRVQSVCGSDPRDVTVKYAQAYLRPVLAPWPNQAPMLMRALHTGRIAPTLILSARLIGRCDHPQAHFKQNTSFNLRMAIR